MQLRAPLLLLLCFSRHPGKARSNTQKTKGPALRGLLQGRQSIQLAGLMPWDIPNINSKSWWSGCVTPAVLAIRGSGHCPPLCSALRTSVRGCSQAARAREAMPKAPNRNKPRAIS